jgi:hypothetical protein
MPKKMTRKNLLGPSTGARKTVSSLYVKRLERWDDNGAIPMILTSSVYPTI